MDGLGILAYGSLITNPGVEMKAATVQRIEQVDTPFPVEFARRARGRGGAPTLVKVKDGGTPVQGVIFVLRGDVSSAEAADMLWRRETNQVGSGRSYTVRNTPGPDTVVVERLQEFRGIGTVLYANIAPNVANPVPAELAKWAIDSARPGATAGGRDGISYLMEVKGAGIRTPLLAAYKNEILRQTGTRTLAEARQVAMRPDGAAGNGPGDQNVGVGPDTN